MRKWIDILNEAVLREMPLVNYQLHGDFDQPGSLDAKNRKLVCNPKHADRMRKLVMRGASLTVHIVNVDMSVLCDHGVQADADSNPDEIEKVNAFSKKNFVGEMSEDDIEDASGVMIDFDPQSINLIVMGNTQATEPLSAWMILHRLGHMLFDGIGSKKISQGLAERLNAFQNYCQEIGYYSLAEVATMRSARMQTLDQISEIVPELIAQYLSAGKITLKHDSGSIVNRNKIRHPIVGVEQRLNELCAAIIAGMVGRGFGGF